MRDCSEWSRIASSPERLSDSETLDDWAIVGYWVEPAHATYVYA